MSHVACTKGIWVDSGLLVVGSQIAHLTPGLSFGHNLCFGCPNGWCEPILDIYPSIDFQWYKYYFKARSFDPCNRALGIQESFWDSNSQHGSSLVNVRVHSLTLFALLGACEVTPGSPSWPTTFQPLALVVTPRLGLRQLWSKERPGIKLPIWLPTTKSRESTQFPYMQVACEIPLETSRQELQFCFRPHCNRRFTREVIGPQSCERHNCGNFRTKIHLDVAHVESCRVYYKGEGDGYEPYRHGHGW
jgi:hypothetical protein